MDTLIAMQDIRNSLAAIADRAENGESFIVVRNSRPAFRISPLSGTETPEREQQVRLSPGGLSGRPMVSKVRERFAAYPVTKDELAPDELDAIIREVRTRPIPPPKS
jgi:antitoxin (DNA-binding transcriptional repressor) of toxin-antitoxin stability system